MKSLITVLFLLFSTITLAEPSQKELQCSFNAGVAREVQTIKNNTDNTLNQFLEETEELYGKTEFYDILVAITIKVYSESIEKNPDDVFEEMFFECITYDDKVI